MSYIRHKTSTYQQVIQSKMIAVKVMHMPLEGLEWGLEAPIALLCAGIFIRDIHRVSGCYHFYPQAVDNYDVGCIA